MVAPVFAITNPDAIAFGTGSSPLYQVFENVNETGDMLFIAEGYVYYATTPTDYTASESYVFQVVDTDGTTVLLSTPLKSFGDRPISIYQTAAQVTALGLVSGTAYTVRIRGNPSIAVLTSSVNATLDANDYTDQSAATDALNPLRVFCLTMASNINTNDDPTNPYIVEFQGTQYLSITQNEVTAIGYNTSTVSTGYTASSNSTSTSDSSTANITDTSSTSNTTYPASTTTSTTTYTYSSSSGLSGTDIFTKGIPGLQTWVPTLFAASVAVITDDSPVPSGAYASGLTTTAAFGTTVTVAIANLATWAGMGTTMMGFVLIGILAIGAAIFAQIKFGNNTVTTVAVVLVCLVGAFLGLVPLAVVFMAVIGISLLMAFVFFARGAI